MGREAAAETAIAYPKADRKILISAAPNLGLQAGHRAQFAVKRSIDIAVAALAMTITLPVMVVVAALVKGSSPGPVLFRQERVGKDRTLFTMIKFRTMRDGTDAEVKQDDELRREYEANGFKLAPNDPRITRIGRFLRATSMDELPQLWNVLVGQMSVVGVRPLVEKELAMRTAYDQRCYISMRPGLTGRWQVAGRSAIGGDEREQLDRTYVEEWTLRGDLLLLIKTPIALARVQHAH